jgi:DNA-binding protein HU-beta
MLGETTFSEQIHQGEKGERAKMTPVTKATEQTPPTVPRKDDQEKTKTPAVKARARAKAKAKTKAAAKPAVKSPDLNKIRRIHIIDIISKTTSNSKEHSATLFDASLEVIAQALKQGTVVGLPGIGTISVNDTAALTTVHPKTAETIQLPAHKRVSYKIAKDLKAAL